MRYLTLSLFFFLIAWLPSHAQKSTFTRQDSLRGTLSTLRSCYDVTFYDLNLNIKPEQRSIQGFNRIHFTATQDFSRLQIDLFENMSLDSILDESGERLAFEREGNATFVSFPEKVTQGTKGHFTVYYQGKPRVAPNPPWDGGFTWQQDKYERHWIGVSCEGLGASVWWPNKDHLSDEPDSMRIYLEVPEELYAVANGNLRSLTKLADDQKGYEWFVNYPINNYNVTLNIAHYRKFSETFMSSSGEEIDLDYFVLDYNLDAAREHFKQVKPMLSCFEQLFGSYPFPKDGYALVETPYWGMEHQGAIAYGNNYRNMPEWNFDFIIIHESGHEYFGNSISVRDHAEMWIHEAFTTYSEALYLECRDNLQVATDYLLMQRKNIKNQVPMLGPLDVNYQDWPDADMYYKGTWMLHTLRSVINNDPLWKKIIFDFHDKNRLSHMNTQEVIAFFEQASGQELAPIFYEYLRYTDVPTLEYKMVQKGTKVRLFYRWKANETDFEMPVEVRLGENQEWIRLKPSRSKWQKKTFKNLSNPKLALNKARFYARLRKAD